MMLSRRFCGLLPFAARLRAIPKPISPLRAHAPCFYFSAERMEFKAETKKLLDIVAKSLYTDSEVFIRELLSNASDALEKQRFSAQANEDLMVNIEIHPNKNQIIIQDNGIGMSRQELIDNLGTIAKSGSKEFIKKLSDEGSDHSSNIIGQFGVGFYSSFIVADYVDVVSRVEGGKAHKWSSDGSGTFDIEQIDEEVERGTRIILHVREDHKNFLDKTEVQKIAQKYSNFINFPITLDGESLNLVKALWARDKKDISDSEYQSFYEYLSNSSDPYQYKMHFASDVPLQIKSILYIPNKHKERFGFEMEKGEVSLYSKRVLIRKDCKEVLLPNFLRFVKGVVDCEDIPLNISRENYQDTALMNKLKTFLTKRILKHLRDEAEKDPAAYKKWYKEFQIFVKEGSIDNDFKKDAAPLNRYDLNIQDGIYSLKDYVSLKKPNQDRIFFMFSPNRSVALDSPYVYALTKAGIPVLIANTHIDEAIFRELDTYEGLKFANVETDTEDVERNIQSVGEPVKEKKGEGEVPAEDITPFSLWMKHELQPFVDKVNVCKKSMKGPAIVISPISSSMRQMAFMRQMIEERTKSGLPSMNLQNLTFQYDHQDPLIVKLNEFRKENPDFASLIVRQIFDNCCMEAGLESDGKKMVKRINSLMERIMDDAKK